MPSPYVSVLRGLLLSCVDLVKSWPVILGLIENIVLGIYLPQDIGTTEMTTQPQIILLFSGKRKSGKDFITDHLRNLLGNRCEVIKISEPIKRYWATQKNLNLNELLSDSEYKEQYRYEMIKWSDEIRSADYGYFCRIVCGQANKVPVWIVSDIRRKTDINWFQENYGNIIKTIRIIADEKTRIARGFEYKAGLDDTMSECDLDDYTDWDLVITNGEGSQLEEQMRLIHGLLAHL